MSTVAPDRTLDAVTLREAAEHCGTTKAAVLHALTRIAVRVETIGRTAVIRRADLSKLKTAIEARRRKGAR